MARTTITKVAIPEITSEGYNLTDSADFETLSTGTENGVDFLFDDRTIIVLKNPTGGDADFTIVLATPAGIASVGGSVTSPVVDVAAAKTHIIKPAAVFKQSDGKIYIDCDVAGEVLVLSV